MSTTNDLFTVFKIHFTSSCFSHSDHFLYFSPDLIHVSRLNSCFTAFKKPLHIQGVGVKSSIPQTPPGHGRSFYHCTYQSSCWVLSAVFSLKWDWQIILWTRSHVLSSLNYLMFFLSCFTNSKHLVPVVEVTELNLFIPELFIPQIFTGHLMTQAQS